MPMNREQVKAACENLFRRAGGSGARSGIFRELPESAQVRLADAALFQETELPIVASAADDGNWLVATTDRVVFSKDGALTSIPLTDLDAVSSLILENGNSDRDDIIVLTSNGRRHEVIIESGYPLSGIWNVLRRLQRLWRDERATDDENN